MCGINVKFAACNECATVCAPLINSEKTKNLHNGK